MSAHWRRGWVCSTLRSSQGVCGCREEGGHGMNEVGHLGLQMGSPRELEQQGAKRKEGHS